MVASKEKVDQQVSHVALFLRDGRVDDERPFVHTHRPAWHHLGWTESPCRLDLLSLFAGGRLVRVRRRFCGDNQSVKRASTSFASVGTGVAAE